MEEERGGTRVPGWEGVASPRYRKVMKVEMVVMIKVLKSAVMMGSVNGGGENDDGDDGNGDDRGGGHKTDLNNNNCGDGNGNGAGGADDVGDSVDRDVKMMMAKVVVAVVMVRW